MQAIQTRYLCPTNSRGSRIKAFAAAGSLTVGYDHALNIERNHRAAAEAFVIKLGWLKEGDDPSLLVSGCLPNGDYAHVLVER